MNIDKLRVMFHNLLSGSQQPTDPQALTDLLLRVANALDRALLKSPKNRVFVEVCAQAHKLLVTMVRRPDIRLNLERALELWNQAYQAAPHREDFALELAELYLWKNQCDDVLELLRNLESQDPRTRARVDLSRYTAHILMGNCEAALGAVSHWPSRPDTHYQRAMALIQSGEIESGQCEFLQSVTEEVPRFAGIPTWQGGPFSEKAALFTMYDTRGGGDELMFATPLASLHSQFETVYIEAEPRSKKLYEESFPGAYIFNIGDEPPWKLNPALPSPEIQSNTRTLSARLYAKPSSFPVSSGHFRCSDSDLAYWIKQTNAFAGGRLKVGLSWRSYHSVGPTARESLTIEDLAPLMMLGDQVAFFNLQYDLTAEDKQELHSKFGVEIYDPTELNQLDDFHGVAAYASSLDVTVGNMNTNMIIACSAGVPFVELAPDYMPVCFLVLPWYSNRHRFLRSWNEDWQAPCEAAATHLAEIIKEERLHRPISNTG